MSEVKFSLPEFCERYEYVRRSPDQPIKFKNHKAIPLNERITIYSH